MKKYFAFGDIHGNDVAFKTSLLNAGFEIGNPDHILLGVGDYFDRGPNSREIYLFLKTMKEKGRALLIMGNHDAFFLDYLMEKDDGLFNIEYNGMWYTINSFAETDYKQESAYFFNEDLRNRINQYWPTLRNFLKDMKYGYKIGNLIFTHAGMDYDFHTKTWIMNYWCQTPRFVAKFKKMPDHTFIFGHWHAKKMRKEFGLPESHETFIYKNFIGLDTCTNLSGFVNFYVFESYAEPEALDETFIIQE